MTGWMWDALMVFAYGGCAVAWWMIGRSSGIREGYRRGMNDYRLESAAARHEATAQRLKAWQARHAADRSERRAEDEERDEDF